VKIFIIGYILWKLEQRIEKKIDNKTFQPPPITLSFSETNSKDGVKPASYTKS